MSIAYAPRLIPYVSEPQLGAAFRRRSCRPDGSLGDSQWWDHERGGWDNAWDPARHLASLPRDADRPARQYLATPVDVADDPATIADVFAIASDRSILSDVDAMPGNQVYNLTRGWSSKPY
ncbi:MAG: hypothetical protein BGO49_11100 [Planctomycetales bacterium 71-10]|nr:MAG: hypothetical protein BGO49_11100 [Planctomycetales bacterium 71-10]